LNHLKIIQSKANQRSWKARY